MKNKSYEITPTGWNNYLDPCTEDVLDDLLLTLTKIQKNALIWTGKEWVFEKVEWVRRKKK